MTPAETEAERRALVKVIVDRLQNHDPDTKPLGVDAEPFATEVVATAMQLGWRPTAARPSPDYWRQRKEATAAPEPSDARKALLAGDYEKARDVLGTTSVVPRPGAPPEPSDQTETETSSS